MPKVNNPFSDNDLISDADAEAQELGAQPPAEPAVEPAPVAPEPQQQAAEPEPPNKTGVVPYDRFKEVNDRAKAAEQERNELREKWARMDERSRQLQEARAASDQARQAAERPDPNIDAVGAELWDTKQALAEQRQAIQAMQQQFQQTTQGLQQSQEEVQFSNWVQNQVQSYSQQDPQYIAKATHAANRRMEFWQQMGLNPDAAKDIVQKESILLAKIAQQNGVNFAPIVAKLATDWGYGQQAPVAQNGPRPMQAPQAQQNSARLEQVRRGQAMQGIGNMPGSGNGAPSSYRNYTPSQIEAMTEAEWNRAMAIPRLKEDLMIAVGAAEGLDRSEMGRL